MITINQISISNLLLLLAVFLASLFYVFFFVIEYLINASRKNEDSERSKRVSFWKIIVSVTALIASSYVFCCLFQAFMLGKLDIIQK